jgi:NTE family protein
MPETMADVLTFVLTVTVRQQAALELPAIAEQVPVVYLPGPVFQRVSPLDFDHSGELYDGALDASRAFLRGLVVTGPGLYGSLWAPKPEPDTAP